MDLAALPLIRRLDSEPAPLFAGGAAERVRRDVTWEASVSDSFEKDEYFALVKDNTPGENALLARQQTGEELLIQLRGQAYRIK